MKIRTGFVSNSSTTSFTCDICGCTEAFHDSVSCEEMGFTQLECGHGICTDHLLDIDEDEVKEKVFEKMESYLKKKWLSQSDFDNYKSADFEDLKEWYINHESYPRLACPICKMKEVATKDMITYAMKKLGITPTKLKSEIKRKFPNIETFHKFLK